MKLNTDPRSWNAYDLAAHTGVNLGDAEEAYRTMGTEDWQAYCLEWGAKLLRESAANDDKPETHDSGCWYCGSHNFDREQGFCEDCAQIEDD